MTPSLLSLSIGTGKLGSQSAPTRSKGRIQELDGLRGVAVLAVIDCHYLAWYPAFGAAYGWLGVDLFFVLSGFLISSILLELRDKEHYFTVFYSRRALRIFPPYFLGLLVYFAFSAATGMLGTLGLWSSYVFYYVSLIIHKPLPPVGHPLGVPIEVAFGLTVLWSLSVEEIYYTIWAPVVRFTGERGFTAILILMILAAPLLRWHLYTQQNYEAFTFYCRMDGLAYGSLVALLIRHRRLAPSRWLRADGVLNWLTIIVTLSSLLCWLAFKGEVHSALAFALGITLADLSFALIVHSMVRQSGSNQFWIRMFRAKWLQSIGMVSYSLYLFHYPLLIVAEDIVARMHLPRRAGVVAHVIIGLILTFTAAYGLWYLMESRILRWKDRKVPTTAHP